MSNIEDLIKAVAELKEIVTTSHRQLNGRMAGIENRITELSGSTAVVLNRSAENKKAIEEHKKKLQSWRITVSSLTKELPY